MNCQVFFFFKYKFKIYHTEIYLQTHPVEGLQIFTLLLLHD